MYADTQPGNQRLNSARNPLLQKIRRAIQTGRATEDGCIVAEGPHLLYEAQRSRCAVDMVLYTAEAMQRNRALREGSPGELIEVSERAFASLAGTETTQGILALVRLPAWSWSDLTTSPAAMVILDGIQDPGNAGAIVRSAEAFGASGVAFLEGSARVSNGKLLRASAGSIFRMPFLEGVSRRELLNRLKGSPITLYALSAHVGADFTTACFQGPFALVTGSEGAGISGEIERDAQVLSIPTGNVESLNAAVACSLVLFEACRQRRRT